MRTRSHYTTIILLAAAGCSSSPETISHDEVVAKDFVSEIAPKKIIETLTYAANPDNNVKETDTLVYENNLMTEIKFRDDKGSKGVIKITRDKVGNIVKTDTYFDNSGTLQKSSYLEYVYSKGLLVELKKYFFFEDKFTFLESTSFTYNDKNQLSKMQVLDAFGKLQREYTYVYNDETTNPLQVTTKHTSNNSEVTSVYEYENTSSPLVVYYQVRGYINAALQKKNIKKVSGGSGSVNPSTVYTYTYNEKELPTKINIPDDRGSTIWEFEY